MAEKQISEFEKQCMAAAWAAFKDMPEEPTTADMIKRVIAGAGAVHKIWMEHKGEVEYVDPNVACASALLIHLEGGDFYPEDARPMSLRGFKVVQFAAALRNAEAISCVLGNVSDDEPTIFSLDHDYTKRVIELIESAERPAAKE